MRLLKAFFMISLLKIVQSDIYMHRPRGSNNRLDEQGRERANGNRMFDSQNNNRGGYNVGSEYFHVGSELGIEWTNQHSCGEVNNHCEIIVQYMCDSRIRDGARTTTIPEKKSQCKYFDCNTDMEYGMNEDYDYYVNCRYRKRNYGLFTADQKLRSDAARYTRQNPAGTRRGYECPEERDYYPYWQPTPWRDIAVMTNNVSRCDYYQQESQNVKGKYYCKPPATYMKELSKVKIPKIPKIPITKEECEIFTYPTGSNNTGNWTFHPSWDLPAPECILSQQTRDNHLGNTFGGFPPMFNWTVFDTPSEHCVMRIRYNISTGDYQGWNGANASHNSKRNDPSTVDIGALVGLSQDEAKNRGYVLKNNPVVKPLGFAKNKILGEKFQLRLAINTAQYGRTFQDRSHSFAIRKPPSEMQGKKIYNLNVRGKRGNIVQVYPAVEYDFVPNRLLASKDDYLHIQWTGSNTNPQNNDGQGLRGTDRSNIVVLTKQNYPEGIPGRAGPEHMKFGHWGNNYPMHLNTASFGGLSKEDLIRLAILSPGQFGGELSELDDAGTYFDLGPRKVTQAGTYHYMCSRNNNFSNRSQKGKLVVSESRVRHKSFGPRGGVLKFSEDGNEGLWVQKGAISSRRTMAIEEWSHETGEKTIQSNDGLLTVGDKYASNYIAVHPFDRVEGSMTLKFQVNDKDATVYRSNDYVLWIRSDCSISGGLASCSTNAGGVYVARVTNKSHLGTIIGVLVVLVILALVIGGTVFYFKKHPDKLAKTKQKIRKIKQSGQSKI